MRFIYAVYNMLHNCIDVTTFDGFVLRIDRGKAEGRLYLEGGMQTWVDAEDSLEPW